MASDGATEQESRRVFGIAKTPPGKLSADDVMLTILGYEGEPKEGFSFNDRALALTVCALLEQFLETAIVSHFEIPAEESRQLFDDNIEGPLSSFANALGIYDAQMRSDLTCIRRIRNAFAHSKSHIDFRTTEIAALVQRLKIPQSSQFSSLSGNKSKSERKKDVRFLREINCGLHER
jgi:hypothetical protein